MARCCLLGPANQTAGLSFEECISQPTPALNGWTNSPCRLHSLGMAPSQVQPQANASMRRSRRRVQRLGDQTVACVLRQHQQDAAPTPISTALQGSLQAGTSYDLNASPNAPHVEDGTTATSRMEDVAAPADSGDRARHSGTPGVQASQTPSRDASTPSGSASGSRTRSILTDIFPSYGRDGPGGWALPPSAYKDVHLMPPSSAVTPTSGAPPPTSDSVIQQQQQQVPLPQVEQQLDTLLRAQMALSNGGESGLHGRSSSSSSPDATTTASDRLSSESEGDAAARQSSNSSGSGGAPGTRSAQRQSQETDTSLQWQSQGSEASQGWSQAPTDSMTTATRPLGVGGPSVQELQAEQGAAAQDGIASLISSIRRGTPPRNAPPQAPLARFLSSRSSNTANSQAFSSSPTSNGSLENSRGDVHAAAGPPRVAPNQEQQQPQQQQNVASSSSDPQKPFEPFQARAAELVSFLLQGVGAPSAAPSAYASATPQRRADPDPRASHPQQQQQQQQQQHMPHAGAGAPMPVSSRSPRSTHSSSHQNSSSSHWSGSSSSSTRMPPRIRRLLAEARQSHQNRSASFDSATGTASSLGSAPGTGTASGNRSSRSSTGNLGTDVLTSLAWTGIEDSLELWETKVKAMAAGQQAAPAPSEYRRADGGVNSVPAGQPEVPTGWLWGRRAGKRARKAATGSELPTAPLQVLARARALAAETSTLTQPRYPRPQLVNPDTQASTAFAPTTGQATHLPSSSSSSSNSNATLTSPRSRNSSKSTTTGSGIGVANRGSGSAAIEGGQVAATGQAGVGGQASSGPEGETSNAAGLLTQAIAMNVVAAAAEQQLQGNGKGPLTAVEEYQQQQQQQQQRQQRRVEQQSVSRDYAPANTAQQQLDELLEAAMANAGQPGHCSWREVCGLIAEFGVCAGPTTLAAMFAAVVRTAPLQATSSPTPSYPQQLQQQQQQQQQQLRVEQPQPVQQQPDSSWLRTALYQGGLGGRYASAATPPSLAYQSISSYDDEEGGALPPSDSSSSSSSSSTVSSSSRNMGRSSARDGFEGWRGPATASGPGRVSLPQGVNREGERCRSVLLKLLRHLLSQLPRASMWDVSLCLHAAAAMKQRHLVAAHRVWPRLVPPLVARMQALIPQASAPELAGGLRALVRLNAGPFVLPRGFTKLVQAQFLALLNGVPGQPPPDHTALGQVGWCLAHLAATPSNGWLKEYSKAATRAVADMYPVELILLSRPLVAWRRGSVSQTRPARSNEAKNTATTHDNDGASNTLGSSRNISSGSTNNSKPSSSNTTTNNPSVSITSRGASSSTLAPVPSRPRPPPSPGISQHLSAQPRSSHPSLPAAAAAEKATAAAPAEPPWEWPPLDLMDQMAQTTLQLLPPPLLPADRITDPALCLMSPPSGTFAAGGSVHKHHLNLMNYHLQQQHILHNLQQQHQQQQHGSANSGHTPEQWLYQQYQQDQLQEWWGQYSRRLRQRWLFPKDVAAVCACLAQAGWRPLPGWVQQLEAAIAPHLQAYSARDLSLIVGSMTALAVHSRSLPPQQPPHPQEATRSSQITNSSMPLQQPTPHQHPFTPQGVAGSQAAGTSTGNPSHEPLQGLPQTAANGSEALASLSAGPPSGNKAVPDQATVRPGTARLPSIDFLALASLNLTEQMVIKQKRQRQQRQGKGAMNQTAQEEGQEQQEQWHQSAANIGSTHPLGQPLAPTASTTHSASVNPDFAQAVSRFVGGLAHLVRAHLKLLKASRAQQAQDAMRANSGGGLGSPGVPQPRSQVRGRASPALHKQYSAGNAGGRGAAAQIAQVRSAGAGSDAALAFEQRGAVDAGACRVAAGVQEKPGGKNTNSARGVAENVNSAGGVAELREAVWMLTANCYQMPGLAASLPANKAAQLLSGLLELSSALNLPPPPRSTLNRLEQAVLTRGGLSVESWQRVQRAYQSAQVAPGQSLQVALLTYL